MLTAAERVVQWEWEVVQTLVMSVEGLERRKQRERHETSGSREMHGIGEERQPDEELSSSGSGQEVEEKQAVDVRYGEVNAECECVSY